MQIKGFRRFALQLAGSAQADNRFHGCTICRCPIPAVTPAGVGLSSSKIPLHRFPFRRLMRYRRSQPQCLLGKFPGQTFMFEHHHQMCQHAHIIFPLKPPPGQPHMRIGNQRMIRKLCNHRVCSRRRIGILELQQQLTAPESRLLIQRRRRFPRHDPQLGQNGIHIAAGARLLHQGLNSSRALRRPGKARERMFPGRNFNTRLGRFFRCAGTEQRHSQAKAENHQPPAHCHQRVNGHCSASGSDITCIDHGIAA